MLEIGHEEIAAAARVIESRILFRYGDPKAGHPSECVKFERELAKKMGVEHALLVTSGTAALICGLAGLGVGPGDEVVIPAYTFIATALAPLAVGALPVIAEVDDSLTLDPRDVEKKLSPHTKVIMPVHMCGLPANMNAMMQLARRHGLKVLEDACQADGGSYKGKRLGSIGHVGAYSFNYFKNMTAGEGGAMVTKDPEVFSRAMIQHDGGLGFWQHGQKLQVPLFAGWNFRMSEIIGAILRVQLRRIDGLLHRTRAHKAKLMAALADSGLRFARNNSLADECATVLPFQFPSEARARAFIAALRAEGVFSWTPIDSGRHVYSNWEVIMEQRGSYHPTLDAFKRPENRRLGRKYSPDMCPRTLDILARTVYSDIRPEFTAAEVRKRVAACRKAAKA
jgi:dTDP-4-amino-4,6-dideoxygalactose transaminase